MIKSKDLMNDDRLSCPVKRKWKVTKESSHLSSYVSRLPSLSDNQKFLKDFSPEWVHLIIL